MVAPENRIVSLNAGTFVILSLYLLVVIGLAPSSFLFTLPHFSAGDWL